MNYYIFYIVYNIINILIIRKYMMSIFKSIVINKNIEIFSYIIYFFVSTIIYILFPIPIIMLFSNILMIFLVQFNYKTTIRNKILLTIYMMIILSLIDIVVTTIINKDILSIDTISKYGSILGWMLQLIICSIILKTIMFLKNIQLNIELPMMFWLTLIIIPLISILLIIMFLYNKEISIKLTISTCIVLIIINITIFTLYDILIQYIKDKMNIEIIEKEQELKLKQFNIIKDYYEKLDIFKHDLKNHLNYIRTCAINNNSNQIIKYIDNITKNTNKDIHIVNSGNMLIDSILNFKLQEVLNNNIKLQYKVTIPTNLKINTLDLVSLIGNLIDNVIEANNRIENIDERYFNIDIKYIENNLIIKLENSFKEVKLDSNNNLKSLKRRNSKYGLGLKSIKNIVNKYNGNMKINIENNIFKTKIILILDK